MGRGIVGGLIAAANLVPIRALWFERSTRQGSAEQFWQGFIYICIDQMGGCC